MKTTLYIGGDYKRPFTAEFTQEEVKQLKEVSVGTLMEHMVKSMVGVIVSKPGEPRYYAERMEIAGFSLSIQVSYYLWSLRSCVPGKFDSVSHYELMTREEFAEIVCEDNPGATMVDFFMEYKGKPIFDAGQATLKYIAGYLNGVEDSCGKTPVLRNIKKSTSEPTLEGLDISWMKVTSTMEDGYEYPIKNLGADRTK